MDVVGRRGKGSPLPSVLLAETSITPLPSGRKYIQIQLLTGERLILSVDVKCTVQEIFDFVCQTLRVQDSRVFGLTYLRDLQEHRFLDLSHKLVKVTPKAWKSAPAWGTDHAGSPTVIFHLRVLIYVDFVRLISCPVSLLHYYLQLRDNARIYWSEGSPIPEERCWEVAALALQADFGDYIASRHQTGYFRPELFFPLWVINSRGMDYIARHMPPMHQDLQGLGKIEAMIRYCREVSRSPVPVNIHLYGLRRCKTDPVDNVVLGIATRGLQMFEIKANGQREHVYSFVWPQIGKLSFEKKKFTLGSVDGKKLIYFTSSDEKSRYLLQFCRTIHQRTMSLHAELSQACNLELQESRLFRESYVYSSEAEIEWAREAGHWPDSLHSPQSPSGTTTSRTLAQVMLSQTIGGQRVSVVSDASSNTTSGIVSDRQQNHDDSEGEHDVDIDLDTRRSPMPSEMSLSSPSGYLDASRSNQSSSNNLDSAVSFTGIYIEQINDDSQSNPMDNSLEMGQASTSEKTMTEPGSEDCQSLDTTTIASERDDDERTFHHHKKPTPLQEVNDDFRLSQLALSAEETIVCELSAIMQSVPKLNSSMDDSLGNEEKTTNLSAKFSIAELRKQTLNGYTHSVGTSLGTSEESRLPLIESKKQISASTQTLDDDDAEESMKTEGTQTSSSYLSYFREKSNQTSRGSSLEDPIIGHYTLNPPHENMVASESSQVDHTLFALQQRAYRIIGSQKSINEAYVETETERIFGSENPSTSHSVSTQYRGGMPPETLVSSYLWEPSRKTSFPVQNFPHHPHHPVPPQNGSTAKTVSMQNLESVVNPPNYEQAMRQRANNKRWTTITGIEPKVMQSLQHNNLHQANSEPGLANSVLISEHPYPSQLVTSFPTNHIEEQQWTHFPRTYSASTTALYQQQVALERPRANTTQYYNPTATQLLYPAAGKASWQPNGLYTRNQNSRSTAPYHGIRGSGGGQPPGGINRVQSMPDNGRGQIVRQLFQEREIIEPPPYPQTMNNNSSESHCCPERKTSSPGYCNDCRKDHSGDSIGKAHFSQVKDLLKQRGRDFPFMRALMQETDTGSRGSTPPATPTTTAENGRPLSWHESCLPTTLSPPPPRMQPLPEVPQENGYADFYHRFASTPNLSDLPPPPPYPCRAINNNSNGYGRSTFGAPPTTTVLR